jgi:phosphopantothenoylcysteine decarboxylase/phosphopantothenate--cysteine ligase
LVIAPATANTIAKLAHGQADNLITITALAARCPVLVAPAMDVGMYEHVATQANLALLNERGIRLIGPAEGRMASGLVGKGRLVEPDELLGHIRLALAQEGPLAGQKIVVTAGGTHELIDPVRFLANRSSGKQGFALAQAALDRGAEVILITGPVHLPTPVGTVQIDVVSAAEMREATLAECKDADGLLMAAAVADFRPSQPGKKKFKRCEGVPKIQLAPTEDILENVQEQRKKTGHPTVIVGFAAESEDLVKNAKGKLEEKGLTLIAANDITATDAGFAVDTNRVTLIDREGGVQELPLMSKVEVAEIVLERAVTILRGVASA